MNIHKHRWSNVYESSEEELIAHLASRQITATRWTAQEFEQCPERELAQPTDVWLAEGSAHFTVGGKRYSMQPGDSIRMPASASLQVTAGMSGCACYEAVVRSSAPNQS